LIFALFNGRKPREAMDHFRAFQNDTEAQSSAKALTVYNTVISGLLHSLRDSEAITLLDKMEKDGPTPDVTTYNTFLSHYLRRKELRGLSSMITRMTSMRIQGDVYTFSTILSCLLQVGRDDAAVMIFSLMQKQGVQPNMAIYTSLLKHQLGNGEIGLKGAMELLKQMEGIPNAQPNCITYATIIAALGRRGGNDPQIAEWKKYIVERVESRGIQMNARAYNVLITECLTRPSSDGIQAALAYYREMQDRRVPITHGTWYMLLSTMIHKQEWGLAGKITEDIYKCWYKPSPSLLHLIKQVRQRTM
jgi:pentatricopeptide repeat protein